VSSDANYIYYVPSNDEDDSFTYTVSDVRNYRDGDTVRTAQSSINITVVNAVGIVLRNTAGKPQGAGALSRREAAVAKLQATEAAMTATRVATQIFGGAGFIDETLVARQYRDSKILEIGEGTSEIQRLVIARDLGLPV
jgi:short-chain 2-methylacyl-CoA dehydrogenase